MIAQQEAVEKAGVTSNEYWAVSSAVLNDTAGPRPRCCWRCRASAAPTPTDLKFITATVRVDFVKVGDDRWNVAESHGPEDGRR